MPGPIDYDPARPLKAWMIGVLANRAKMAIRQRRRAPSSSGAVAVPMPSGPVDAAQAQEAAQQVGRALASLPSHYRQVLVLHLVHGLGGVQIAQALERPPATVRTQIKRGLELLRGALPATLAVPAALLVAERRGLAAMRVAVLEVAAPGAVAGAAVRGGTSLALTAGGIMLMKKALVGVVAAVVATLVWLVVDSSGPAERARAAGEEPRGKTLVVAPLDAMTKPERQREASRVAASAPATTAASATMVRGRIVAAWNGLPQLASRISIAASATDTAVFAPTRRWPERLCEGAGRADGTFEFSFVVEPKTHHSIEIYGETFVPVSGSIEVHGPGMHDLGDILVQRGARLRARVVDEAGQPMPGVEFLNELSPQLSFALPRPTTEPIVVRLAPRQPVHVHVLTRDDAPVAGSLVQLVHLNDGEEITTARVSASRQDAWQGMHPRLQTRWPRAFVADAATTDAQGHVHLRCATASGTVGVRVTGATHRPFQATAVALGATPLVVVVEAGASLRGRLLPASLAARFCRSPTAPEADRLFVALRRPGAPITRPSSGRNDGYPLAADGTFAIAGLDPGRWEVVVTWLRPMRASSWTTRTLEPPLATIDLTAGEAHDLRDLDATGHLPATIRGRAFHAGAKVADGRVTATRRYLDAAGIETIESDLGGVRTDGEGRFALGGLLEGTYTIHVEHVAADGTERNLCAPDVVVRGGMEIDQLFELQ